MSEIETGRAIVTQKYKEDLQKYQLRVTKEFKERIIQKAKELKKEAEEQRVHVYRYRKSKSKKERRLRSDV